MHGSTGQLPFSALDPSLELEPWPRRQCADFQPNPILLALLATALQTFSRKGNTKLMNHNSLVLCSHEFVRRLVGFGRG